MKNKTEEKLGKGSFLVIFICTSIDGRINGAFEFGSWQQRRRRKLGFDLIFLGVEKEY